MKRRIIELVLLLGVLLVIGALVVVSGIVPVKASGGHLPGVAWMLEFASGRSIATHSVGIEVPPLDDPGLVKLGAVAYQSNCQWCHGGPLEPAPVVAAKMLPHPPYLPSVVGLWEPQELFTIVKHGIKFAGMPAWPTLERDEEVWAVVAFLLKFPSLDHSEYAGLFERDTISHSDLEPVSQDKSKSVQSSPPIGEVAVWQHCDLCHGRTGSPPVSTLVPVLQGQSADYLRNAMQAYQSGARVSGIMQPIASRLRTREVEGWIEYYAASSVNHQMPGEPSDQAVDSSADESTDGAENGAENGAEIELGRELVFEGDQSDKIPSCVDCHGPTQEPRRRDYPNLTGQPADYLVRQLELFASEARGGPQSNIMREIAHKLSAAQRRAVAEFYQSLSR